MAGNNLIVIYAEVGTEDQHWLIITVAETSLQ
jgi:hypothetical protein